LFFHWCCSTQEEVLVSTEIEFDISLVLKKSCLRKLATSPKSFGNCDKDTVIDINSDTSSAIAAKNRTQWSPLTIGQCNVDNRHARLLQVFKATAGMNGIVRKQDS